MRSSFLLVVLCLSLLGVGPAAAEEPEPVGNLAEVMRAVLFPNSNFLFDVQTADPGNPPAADQEGTTTTAMFSGIYKGWQVVEQAAIALAEAERLILVPRKCENGKPAPVDQEDYIEWVEALTEAGKATLAAARKKDRDAVIELTNNVAIACEDCHNQVPPLSGSLPPVVPALKPQSVGTVSRPSQ